MSGYGELVGPKSGPLPQVEEIKNIEPGPVFGTAIVNGRLCVKGHYDDDGWFWLPVDGGKPSVAFRITGPENDIPGPAREHLSELDKVYAKLKESE